MLTHKDGPAVLDGIREKHCQVDTSVSHQTLRPCLRLQDRTQRLERILLSCVREPAHPTGRIYTLFRTLLRYFPVG
jgi:hypothetical protein